MKCGMILMTCPLVFGSLVYADRPDFNDKEAPQTLGDFREIQNALQSHLARTRSATVCLQMGGGSGSAVIISKEGLVLTAAHVTSKVDEEIKVIMEDGREFTGRSLGLNSETDSAMLQIEGAGPFPFVEVDLKDTTRLGDWVFSLGHSGGFDKARGVNVRVGRLVREAETTVQSDCMLIGGDSGGPLFNMEGELIAIHSRVGASREESMHVPIREFQAHWDELKSGKFIGDGGFAQKSKPGTGFLGVATEESEEGGLKVTELWKDGVAEKVGLKVGDRIIEIAGEKATKVLMANTLAELGAGDKLTLKWISGGKSKEESIKLGERP
ncbi:S1C family serine protease [Akkermansiaceae bacterium]|nr:S1C family serine protease [Akkermansiaceae bacterium]